MSGQPLPAAFGRATGVPALLRAMSDSDPGRPRLTWYDDSPGPTRGERIELSARVLANWVAKAANLLVDELDVEPGDVVVVDLPVHWRGAYWVLAGLSAGATVVVSPGDVPADVRVWLTDDPLTAPPAGTVVAVTLPALARAWVGAPLPDGVVDEAASVTGQPDVFEPAEQPDAGTTALVVGGTSLTYDQLMPAAQAAGVSWAAGVRLLSTLGALDPVGQLLAPLLLDGSIVLVRDPDPALQGDRRETELVTAG
ncbi:MAG TPA: TIGR03089 family protein [Actinomycetales bacterium]